MTIQEDIHKNAVDHGWWETPRPIGELVALVHSEVSEALEGFRNRDMENVVEELADVKIRLHDFAQGLHEGQVDLNPKGATFPDQLAELHTTISQIHCCAHDRDAVRLGIYLALVAVDKIAKSNNLDVDEAMIRKHEINKARAYRHGGKVC